MPAKNQPKARIRMYRHGLGDCFLVTLPGKDGAPFHLMIDCGVVLGTPDAEAQMSKVVENIVAETGGHVDVLAATHEHWDHVSGFLQARESFKDLTVGEVWLAWTEQPGNKLALKLKRENAEKVNKLRMAAAAAGPGAVTGAIEEVLGFFGAAGGRSTADAMQALRKLAPGDPRYCRPADAPIAPERLDGFRVFVLGPPEDEKMLKKLVSSKELYKDAIAALDWSLGMDAAGARGPELDGTPFDQDSCIPLEEVRQRLDEIAKAGAPGEGAGMPGATYGGSAVLEFFDQHYFGKATDSPYTDQRWRRIDGDWLGAAAEFALQLDSITNNTSLVLAIEHVASGKVLLFAADAQLGNWLSWQDLEWKIDGGKVTGPDLLHRTVVYKVGHHGSHNATPRGKGLEMMVSEDLAALVPVDHKMAVKKSWTRMPLPALMNALRTQARRRVLRTDEEFREDRLEESVRAGFEYRKDDLYYDLFVALE